MAGMSAKQRALQSAKFKHAWQKAREAAEKYGGKAYQYFLIKGENVIKDEQNDWGKIVVDPNDLPYLPWRTWSKKYPSLYHQLERESKLASSSQSWLILNIADDDFDMRFSNYKSWVSTKEITNEHVIIEQKESWQKINGKEVKYLASSNTFVYLESYEAYKKERHIDIED